MSRLFIACSLIAAFSSTARAERIQPSFVRSIAGWFAKPYTTDPGDSIIETASGTKLKLTIVSPVNGSTIKAKHGSVKVPIQVSIEVVDGPDPEQDATVTLEFANSKKKEGKVTRKVSIGKSGTFFSAEWTSEALSPDRYTIWAIATFGAASSGTKQITFDVEP